MIRVECVSFHRMTMHSLILTRFSDLKIRDLGIFPTPRDLACVSVGLDKRLWLKVER